MIMRINLIIHSILIILFVNIPFAFAVPSISNVIGDLVDGRSITLSGSNFGTNGAVGTTDLQWLSSNIEAGVEGNPFSAPGWTSTAAVEGVQSRVEYDNEQAHSGSQSLMIYFERPGGSGIYKGYFTYSRGTEMSKVYFSWWIRANWDNGSAGQWKIFRISNSNSPVDSTPEFYLNNWWGLQRQFFCRPVDLQPIWYCADNPPGDHDGVLWLSDGQVPGGTLHWDKWVRMEFYIEGSDQGVKNGTCHYWLHEPGIKIEHIVDYEGNLLVYGVDQTDRLKYIIFGHYVGGNDATSVKTWWDDVFVQVGGRQRVEIGDAVMWNNCKHREIQIPTAWSANSITITVNRGSFGPCETLYLFVVDADGNVNTQGYPIRIVTGASEPPCPPKGLKVKQ